MSKKRNCPAAEEKVPILKRHLVEKVPMSDLCDGYLNLGGTFYYLCSILDGYSRHIVHREIRESMTKPEVETIIQRAWKKYPGENPRIITDNGPQSIAKDFKEFIRVSASSSLHSPSQVTTRK